LIDFTIEAETPKHFDSAADIAPYLVPLKESRSLKRIVLSGHSYGSPAIEEVALLLSNQTCLEVYIYTYFRSYKHTHAQELVLADIFTHRSAHDIVKSLGMIARSLITNTSLRVLDISSNAIGEHGAPILGDLIEVAINLEFLNMNDCG
jgi:Ran GTPase-activating protein (RanGAP) involved in mRNA processing and transport